jgi:hypothetical protein
MKGDVRKYEVREKKKKSIVGKILIGGSIKRDGKVRVVEEKEMEEKKKKVFVKGKRMYG